MRTLLTDLNEQLLCRSSGTPGLGFSARPLVALAATLALQKEAHPFLKGFSAGKPPFVTAANIAALAILPELGQSAANASGTGADEVLANHNPASLLYSRPREQNRIPIPYPSRGRERVSNPM